MNFPLSNTTLFLLILFLSETAFSQDSETNLGTPNRVKLYADALLDRFYIRNPWVDDENFAVGYRERRQRMTLGAGCQFGETADRFWEISGRFMGYSNEIYNADFVVHPDSVLGKSKERYPSLMVIRYRKLQTTEKNGSAFGLGISSDFGYFQAQTYRPDVFFNQTKWYGGLSLQLEYRHIRQPSKRFRTEFGFGVSPISTNYIYQKIENPVLSPRQQENGSFDMDSFQSVRLFAALSFGVKKGV